MFGTYTTTTQLYEDFYSKLYIDNMFLTPTQTGTLHYNKTDTGNLLKTNYLTQVTFQCKECSTLEHQITQIRESGAMHILEVTLDMLN